MGDDRLEMTSIELTGALDRQTAEALYLELRYLAKRYDATVRELRIEKMPSEPSE